MLVDFANGNLAVVKKILSSIYFDGIALFNKSVLLTKI